jgi:hypothetical protein
MMRISNIRDALDCSLIDANFKWTAAKKELKSLAKQGWTLRDTHSDALDAAKAEANDTSPPIEAKRRKTIEQQRRQGRTLRRLKQTSRAAVTQVFITNSEGHRIKCNFKEDIEEACIKENHRRFNQTADTPPMENWIIEQVGYCGGKSGAHAILDGTFDTPPTCDPYLKLLIPNMRMPNCVKRLDPISTEISTETHVSGWRRQKERTALTRSDLSFSDHIAATFHSGMTEIDRLFRQIPYKLGFSPQRYRRITDFEIPKKAGLFDVELMCTIQLMVAAFNMNNKLTGKRAMARDDTGRAVGIKKKACRDPYRSDEGPHYGYLPPSETCHSALQ